MVTSNFDSLFLDRDGVINKKLEGRYVSRWEEFEFMPNALQAVNILSKLFKRIFIVTNQQGIGKGIMSQNNLLFLHQRMIKEVEKAGGKIDKIYFVMIFDFPFAIKRVKNTANNSKFEDYVMGSLFRKQM